MMVNENGRRRREEAASSTVGHNLRKGVCRIVACDLMPGLHCWRTLSDDGILTKQRVRVS